jgi:hypothetical protein
LLQSTAQGAATSVYVAVSKEWEVRGYLSDCLEQGRVKADHPPLAPGDDGYAAWAFDEEKAARLWKMSCVMVGVEDDTFAVDKHTLGRKDEC